jgi:hypothetical protein
VAGAVPSNAQLDALTPADGAVGVLLEEGIGGKLAALAAGGTGRDSHRRRSLRNLRAGSYQDDDDGDRADPAAVRRRHLARMYVYALQG